MTRKKAPDMENTLDAEGTIRMHYLRDNIRGIYYTNRHIGQDVSLDGIKKAELGRASPAATLKVMVYARYLFMEIWQSRILEDTIEATLERKGMHEYAQLEGMIEQDRDTKALVEKMRHRFSTHPNFTLEQAIEEIGAMGFQRFWMCVQRILMFKDAISVVSYTPRSFEGIIKNVGNADILPVKTLTWEEKRGFKKRYESPAYDVDWGEGETRRLLQECVACLKTIMDEHMVSTALHRCYKTQKTLERLVSSTYNLKYVILEVYEFMRVYKTLGIPHSPESPTEPEFFARKKKYCLYRNKYAAHDDKHVPSIMLIFEDSSFVSELARDVEEIIILARRMCGDYKPNAEIPLPTHKKTYEMDMEMDKLRKQSHEWLGNKFLNSEYEIKCDELRAAVTAAYGLK